MIYPGDTTAVDITGRNFQPQNVDRDNFGPDLQTGARSIEGFNDGNIPTTNIEPYPRATAPMGITSGEGFQAQGEMLNMYGAERRGGMEAPLSTGGLMAQGGGYGTMAPAADLKGRNELEAMNMPPPHAVGLPGGLPIADRQPQGHQGDGPKEFEALKAKWPRPIETTNAAMTAAAPAADEGPHLKAPPRSEDKGILHVVAERVGEDLTNTGHDFGRVTKDIVTGRTHAAGEFDAGFAAGKDKTAAMAGSAPTVQAAADEGSHMKAPPRSEDKAIGHVVAERVGEDVSKMGHDLGRVPKHIFTGGKTQES